MGGGSSHGACAAGRLAQDYCPVAARHERGVLRRVEANRAGASSSPIGACERCLGACRLAGVLLCLAPCLFQFPLEAVRARRGQRLGLERVEEAEFGMCQVQLLGSCRKPDVEPRLCPTRRRVLGQLYS